MSLKSSGGFFKKGEATRLLGIFQKASLSSCKLRSRTAKEEVGVFARLLLLTSVI